MITGIDIGYTYTKDSNYNIFRSAYTESNLIVTAGRKITIGSETFYVGDGKGVTDLDKCTTTLNRVCLLADLAMSEDDEFYIVTGLPIDQYHSQKDKLKEFIMQQNKTQICLEDTIEKTIKIKDVKIFPQGAAALFSQDVQEDALIVDVGGRTIDVALMERDGDRHRLQQHNTWFEGMLVLYSKIIDAVNQKFELTLQPRYAEKILRDGLFIFSEKQDISFLKPILQCFFEDVFQELSLNYPSKTTRIYLCGGGANILFNAFKKRFPDVYLFEHGQFANAVGYYKVGYHTFGKYDKTVSNQHIEPLNKERSTLVWRAFPKTQ